MKSILKVLLNLILAVGVGFLSYQLYLTIQEPIVFNEMKSARDGAAQVRLKQIRSVQMAFKSDNQRYSKDWAELQSFAKSGEYKMLKKIGDPNDTTIVARVDTIRKSVLDSIFRGDVSQVDSMRFIPYAQSNKFLLDAGNVVKNELEIPAFEVKAPYKTLYDGLIRKYWVKKRDKYISIGSMEDGSTGGNWGE